MLRRINNTIEKNLIILKMNKNIHLENSIDNNNISSYDNKIIT